MVLNEILWFLWACPLCAFPSKKAVLFQNMMYPFFESAQTFDLIISDIRKFEDDTPMILITAFPDDETRKQAGQLGALAVFEKPFDVDALVAEVRRILPSWLDGKSSSANPALQHGASLPFPIDITFRQGKAGEAINAFIRDMAAKLNPFSEHIRQVHVVVEDLSPEAHRKHRHHISIRVVIDDDKLVVVSHNTDHVDSHENLYIGIRIAFGMARRLLKHSLGKRRTKRFTQREPSQQEIVDECE